MPAKRGSSKSRLVVFLDEANVYNDARRAFHPMNSADICGRFDPMKYARLITRREPYDAPEDRHLSEVRVYAGMPGPQQQPELYAARRRQHAAWTNAGATVIARPLRYPFDWPESRAEQKGIDVQIAIDLVVMALRGDLDVAVLASTDTDLKPALEAYEALSIDATIEVAAWKKNSYAKRLTVSGQHVWCHYLGKDDYRAVHDPRDYNAP